MEMHKLIRGSVEEKNAVGRGRYWGEDNAEQRRERKMPGPGDA